MTEGLEGLRGSEGMRNFRGFFSPKCIISSVCNDIICSLVKLMTHLCPLDCVSYDLP